MKFLKFLFGFALFSCVKCQASFYKYEVMINQTIEECRLMENATVKDAAILYSEDDDVWPESREGKCLIECFFEEMGIVSLLYKNFPNLQSDSFPVQEP
jgi:hypothetical protein